jgi:hypothetical protein
VCERHRPRTPPSPTSRTGKPRLAPDENDTVYIQGLPTDITEEEVAKFFGSIGIIKVWPAPPSTRLFASRLCRSIARMRAGRRLIRPANASDPTRARRQMYKKNKRDREKVPKVHIYTDKVSGRPKGDCTVTYEDPDTAPAAIKWFDGARRRALSLGRPSCPRAQASRSRAAAERSKSRSPSGAVVSSKRLAHVKPALTQRAQAPMRVATAEPAASAAAAAVDMAEVVAATAADEAATAEAEGAAATAVAEDMVAVATAAVTAAAATVAVAAPPTSAAAVAMEEVALAMLGADAAARHLRLPRQQRRLSRSVPLHRHQPLSAS